VHRQVAKNALNARNMKQLRPSWALTEQPVTVAAVEELWVVWKTEDSIKGIQAGFPSPVGKPRALPWGVTVHNSLSFQVLRHSPLWFHAQILGRSLPGYCYERKIAIMQDVTLLFTVLYSTYCSHYCSFSIAAPEAIKRIPPL